MGMVTNDILTVSIMNSKKTLMELCIPSVPLEPNNIFIKKDYTNSSMLKAIRKFSMLLIQRNGY